MLMFTTQCSADPLHQRFGLRPIAHCPMGQERAKLQRRKRTHLGHA